MKNILLQIVNKYLVNSLLSCDQMSCAKCEVVIHFASASVYIELDQLDITIISSTYFCMAFFKVR